MKFEITKHWELRALQKALWFVKFQQYNPESFEVTGSPIIVDVYTRLLESLDEYYKSTGFLAPNATLVGGRLRNTEIVILKEALLLRRESVQNKPRELKIKLLQTLIAPCTVSEEEFDDLLACLG